MTIVHVRAWSDARTDIADGRRLTTRRRLQVGSIVRGDTTLPSDPLLHNVAFVAEKEEEAPIGGCYTGSIHSSNHPLPTTK